VLAHTDRAIVLEKGSVAVAGASKALALESAALARWLGV
jgi:branched-chain amino acid transport system ATP-binding protein